VSSIEFKVENEMIKKERKKERKFLLVVSDNISKAQIVHALNEQK
jgi:hypothetical protein